MFNVSSEVARDIKHNLSTSVVSQDPNELKASKLDTNHTVKQLMQAVQSFCEARDWDQFHNPKDIAVGIITEAAELLDHFRFLSEEQMRTLLANSTKKKEVEHELADTFFFVLRFAQRFDIDLSSALYSKIEMNSNKYPLGTSKGSNQKYTEL